MLHCESPLRSFVEPETDDPPPARFTVFPPKCVTVFNVVTQVHFDAPCRDDRMMDAYFFCSRNPNNYSAVILKTDEPSGSAGIYGENGMMMITGSSSARKSRYTADQYLDMIRACDDPRLKIKDFRVTNLTTSVNFGAALDVERYKRDVCPELVYNPSGFTGARKTTKRTGALLTLFARNATLLGACNIYDLCADAHDELDIVAPCTVPIGSEEEAELTKRMKSQSMYAHVAEEEDDDDDEAAILYDDILPPAPLNTTLPAPLNTTLPASLPATLPASLGAAPLNTTLTTPEEEEDDDDDPINAADSKRRRVG